jgi:hypothetical protein
MKTTMMTFFYYRRDVCKKFVPEGNIVNGEHNLEELKHLLARMEGLRADM